MPCNGRTAAVITAKSHLDYNPPSSFRGQYGLADHSGHLDRYLHAQRIFVGAPPAWASTPLPTGLHLLCSRPRTHSMAGHAAVFMQEKKKSDGLMRCHQITHEMHSVYQPSHHLCLPAAGRDGGGGEGCGRHPSAGLRGYSQPPRVSWQLPCLSTTGPSASFRPEGGEDGEK